MIRAALVLVVLAFAGGALIAMLRDGTLRQTLLVFEAMDIMILFFVLFFAVAEKVAPARPSAPGENQGTAQPPSRAGSDDSRRAG